MPTTGSKVTLIQEAVFRIATRLMLPDLARQMQEEGTFHLRADDPVASLEEAEFMHVDDNAADVTIVTFTGPDVLYMGHSRHHLMGVIKRAARRFGGANLIFLRDPQRVGFMLRPDGSQDGFDFYIGVLEDMLNRMGASHNVAIGASWGGSIAHYVGCRCPIDQVITFSPFFQTSSYVGIGNAARALLNAPQLFREPRGYVETLSVSVAAGWCLNMVKQKVNQEIPDLIETYQRSEARPRAAIYYGEYSQPDAEQARLMNRFPEVTLKPLPTGRHNTPGYLYAQRRLGKVIAEEILAARGAAPVSVDTAHEGQTA